MYYQVDEGTDWATLRDDLDRQQRVVGARRGARRHHGARVGRVVRERRVGLDDRDLDLEPVRNAESIEDVADAEGDGERLLVGEIVLPLEQLVQYYGTARPGVHLPFNFQLVEASWDAPTLRQMIAGYEGALPPGGWPNWVMASHDYPRIAARLGEAQARVAAMRAKLSELVDTQVVAIDERGVRILLERVDRLFNGTRAVIVVGTKPGHDIAPSQRKPEVQFVAHAGRSIANERDVGKLLEYFQGLVRRSRIEDDMFDARISLVPHAAQGLGDVPAGVE